MRFASVRFSKSPWDFVFQRRFSELICIQGCCLPNLDDQVSGLCYRRFTCATESQYEYVVVPPGRVKVNDGDAGIPQTSQATSDRIATATMMIVTVQPTSLSAMTAAYVAMSRPVTELQFGNLTKTFAQRGDWRPAGIHAGPRMAPSMCNKSGT